MKFTLFGLNVEFACMSKGLESGLSNCNSGWPRQLSFWSPQKTENGSIASKEDLE